jgi:hypothetical protein
MQTIRALRRSTRFRLVEPSRYFADVVKMTLGGSRAPLLKVLMLSDQAEYTSEQQFAPLLAGRSELRNRFGIALHHALVHDALLLPPRVMRHYDVALLKLGFRTSAEDAVRVAGTLRERLSGAAKLVYFDGDDDVCVQWPKLLPLVDLYVKKHCFRNRFEYRQHRLGKNNLTDYVARTFGTSFENDIIPRSTPVDEDQVAKIALGWNIALDDKIRQLSAAHTALPRAESKDIDIVCRATANPQSWTYPLRAAVIPKMEELRHEYRVLTPTEAVAQDVYHSEMLRARVCVSPFGFGEICWRDFEAVICGCVLVKPDMSHVETEPDIFLPDETYVPVRWDYADLEQTLRELLADPVRCERIRRRAYAALRDYLDGRDALKKFDAMLRALCLEPGGASRASSLPSPLSMRL